MTNPFSFPRIDPINAIVLMFAITQVLGLVAGIMLIEAVKTTPEVQYLSVSPVGDTEDPLNAVFFVGYVLAGAVGALLAIHFLKGTWSKWAFRFLEVMVVSGSVSVLIFAYLQGLAHMEFYSAMALSSGLGFAFGVAKFFLYQLKNPAAVLSSAGVGAIFGFSMGFWPALLFILGLSLYDYIAVFKTRHMLTLAKNLGDRNMSFTITAESREDKSEEQRLAAEARANERLAQARTPPKASKHPLAHASMKEFKPMRTSERPAAPPADTPKPSGGSNIDRLDLGSGDLAIPAMLAVSSYTIAGWAGSLAVVTGSVVSIFFLLRFVIEKRVALPALPPICMGALSALLITILAEAALKMAMGA